jgi:hypothetical protein
MSERDYHLWIKVGENTGGDVFWCQRCGAVDEGDQVIYPHFERAPMNEPSCA